MADLLLELRQVNNATINKDENEDPPPLSKIFHTWRLFSKIGITKRKTSALVKQDTKNTTNHRIEELEYAWQTRDLAHTWKIGKQLAGKPLRTIAPRGRMNEEEWAQGLGRDGREAGYAAKQIDTWKTWAINKERSIAVQLG